VAGYLEMLEFILESHENMKISEALILQLHRDMLIHSEKDQRQRGAYKFGPNRVEAKDQSGNIVGVVFDPTPPHLTPKEMQDLIAWLQWVIFEYLAIHPFQDGNGRTSRLLTNLLLLQNGYNFTRLVSHEKLIEDRKQSSWKTDAEDISAWMAYFLDIVKGQAQEAMKIIEEDRIEGLLSEKQLALWQWAQRQNDQIFSRKEATDALGFPPRTVEAIIKKLLDLKKLERLGTGRATRYKVR